jgi:hypothetical protein
LLGLTMLQLLALKEQTRAGEPAVIDDNYTSL